MKFCDDVIANGSILCRTLASFTASLKASWAFVKVLGFFFSFGLVIAIVMVVVVVAKKERREIRLLMLSLR